MYIGWNKKYASFLGIIILAIMVFTTTLKKRKKNHLRFLVIAAMILTVSAGSANAASKPVVKKAKKATTSVIKKVKGEKIIANKIAVIGDNTISTYKVKDGDTLSSIAQKFDISVNTIRWSNDINSKDTIKPGQTLTILPTSGVIYTVKSGDTLSGIALKLGADQNDILNANDLDNADSLKVGMKLAIPDVEPLTTDSTDSVPDTTTPTPNIAPIAVPDTATPEVIPPTVSTATPEVVSSQTPGTTMMVTNPVTAITYPIVVTAPTTTSTYPIPADDIRGYYAQPITGRLSQGIHDVNAVDIAAPVGTTVHAAADGTIIVMMVNGSYNGGYGNYIVISHPNGTQTLYAHLSKTLVTLGEMVTQGQPIALSGNTGKTTGAHLHFEIRGAVNPWGSDPLGTEYVI